MTRFIRMLPIILAALAFYIATPMQPYTHAEAENALPLLIPKIYIPNLNQFILKPGTPPNNTGPKTSDANGNQISCHDLTEAKGGVLLGYIVPCVSYTVEQSTMKFSAAMIAWLMPTVYAFLTFVIVMFGVKMLQGERQVHVQGFLLLVKVTFVLLMLNIIPSYVIPQVYGIMNQSVAVASGALGGSEGGIGCDVEKYGDENTALVWKQSDCILGRLYGFTTGKDVAGQSHPNMLLASSAFGLLAGFAFGGTIGVAVFFAFIGVLVSVMLLVLRVAVAFLNGYLIACVMLLIAPIFLPLVFLKVTNDYFEKWWKAILGAMILPVIIVSYSTIALLVYDALLFKPGSLMQKLFDQSEIQSALKTEGAVGSFTVTNNTDNAANALQKQLDPNAADVNEVTDPQTHSKLMDMIAQNPYLQIFGSNLSGANNPFAAFKKTRLDISAVNQNIITHSKDPDFADPHVAMKRLFVDAVKIFVMAYLISGGLAYVQSTFASFAAGSLIGSSLVTSSTGAIASIQNTIQSFRNNMSQAYMTDKDGKAAAGKMGVSGTDFLQRTVSGGPTGRGALTDSMKKTMEGFMGGTKRNDE